MEKKNKVGEIQLTNLASLGSLASNVHVLYQSFQVTEVKLCSGHSWRLCGLNLQGLMVMTLTDLRKILTFAD